MEFRRYWVKTTETRRQTSVCVENVAIHFENFYGFILCDSYGTSEIGYRSRSHLSCVNDLMELL